MPPKLGVLAGSGLLPVSIAEACKSSGREVFVVALEGCANVDSFAGVPHAAVPMGAVGRIFRLLREQQVEEVVLAGAVKRPSWTELKPDLEGAMLLAKFAAKVSGDDGVLGVIVREIEARGFRVVGAHEVLKDLAAPEAVLGRLQPDATAQTDIARAITVAKALGAVDVGQAVIVQQGIVLGVEAVEGTDALIRRSADVKRGGPGGVLVKIAKPRQERRADLPAIGPQTVKNAAAAGLRGVAVEAGGAIILDRAAAVAAADELGLFLAGVRVRDSAD